MSNMSKPVAVPETVEVELSPGRLRLKGPLGESERTIPPALEVHYDAERRLVSVRRTGEDRSSRALQGLYRTLVANMVQGVSSGFRKALEVHGTGYNVNLQGRKLVLQVGFSHEVVFEVPEGLDVEIEQNTAQPNNPARFAIKGTDKEKVGQFAADVRAIRPPEPYKGKGIRYAGEHVRRKQGKAFAGLQ